MWLSQWGWRISQSQVLGIYTLKTHEIKFFSQAGPRSRESIKWRISLFFTREELRIVLFHPWSVCYSYLSHKLRCYTGISGPEKNRNNTREKISYFFTCVDIANQLLTRHSPLAPLGQVDKWMAKRSRFSIQVVCRSFLELRQLKH